MFTDNLTDAVMLRLDQMANLGASFEVMPAFVGEPIGLDRWAWDLGRRETIWCKEADSNPKHLWKP